MTANQTNKTADVSQNHAVILEEAQRTALIRIVVGASLAAGEKGTHSRDLAQDALLIVETFPCIYWSESTVAKLRKIAGLDT